MWRPGAAIILGLALALPSRGWAELLAPSPPEATARLVALEAVSPSYQPAVRSLLDSKPLHIRISPSLFRTTTRIYDYLLERPSLAATLCRALALGLYVIEPTSPRSFRGDDQQGLSGTFTELVSANGRRVYLVDGRYDGRWLRGVTGRAIIVLRYEPVALDDGLPAVANTFDLIARLDNSFLHALARLLNSVLQGLMEGKIQRAIQAAKALSERLASDPEAVHRATARTPAVTPAERAEFARWFLQPLEGNLRPAKSPKKRP